MKLAFSAAGIFGAIVLSARLALAAAAPAPDDAYIAGYVAAVLEREFRISEPAFDVNGGVVTVYAGTLSDVQQDKIATILAGIRGVRVIRVTDGMPPTAAPERPADTPVESVPDGPPPAEAEKLVVVTGDDRKSGIEVLPRGGLFAPLIADPRWAHFSAAYQYFIDDEEIGNAGSVSFGETFGLLRGPAPYEGHWQLDFQAAVFGLFDLEAESLDLVNADYWVGIPLSYRRGDFSAMLRVFHQSSHLGDEFLLRSRIDRVNLSYEAADLKFSYDIGSGFRVYGGGGVLLHREPADLDRLSTQIGLEYLAPYTIGDGLLRPVAAADLQNRQESDWRSDVSLRAGVQFESPDEVSQRVQLMLEYFNGRNPNGQFYDRTLEYVGFGTHVYF
jgi:opacity protein-like surface antigen